MPYPAWKHYCTDFGGIVTLGQECCSSCGAFGQYDGFRLGRLEAMAAYQRRTGLKPIGAHRPLADMLLGPMFCRCKLCRGRGLILHDDDAWETCPRCRGTKCVRTVPAAEFEATRRRILREFPGAGER